jgi:exonuclease VII large subunit
MEMILPDAREIRYTLDEMQGQFAYVMEQKLQQSNQSLKHIEEMLLRSSPLRLLLDVSVEFERLRQEYNRMFEYRLERFFHRPVEVAKTYTQTLALTLQQKEQQLALLYQKFSLYDPKLACKTGWAQVSLANKGLALSELNIDDRFVLQDAHTLLEVVCVSKEKL